MAKQRVDDIIRDVSTTKFENNNKYSPRLFMEDKIKNYNGKIVFPLIMPFDDYENNNPLGNHKDVSNKYDAVYLSCPVVPPQFQSKLENLFILFNTKHRVQFTNKIVFSRAIQEI